MQIPISKGKELFIDVDVAKIMNEAPEEALKEIIFQGLKQVLNRGMSQKFASSKKAANDAEAEKNNKALHAKAEANLADVWANKVRVTGGKAKTKGADRALNVEAMRLARIAVKEELKRLGKKVSKYKAKDITIAAQGVLAGEHGAAILAKAKANLAEPTEELAKIDLAGLKEDPELVKKAAIANAKKKAGAKHAQA